MSDDEKMALVKVACCGEETTRKKLNISIGQVVTHLKSPLGIGLVVERRDEPLSYKVLWPKVPRCDKFICAEYLRPAQ